MNAVSSFEWDELKNLTNLEKHNVAFQDAIEVFADPYRKIFRNEKHSIAEERFYCIGRTKIGICTVRFTMRGEIIRVIGAGYWREGKKFYENAAG